MKDVSNSATPDQPGNVHNATGNFYSSIFNIVTYIIFFLIFIFGMKNSVLQLYIFSGK
jgi:hypothetical protein